MNLARYLVIQAIKNKKIRGRSALRAEDQAAVALTAAEYEPGALSGDPGDQK